MTRWMIQLQGDRFDIEEFPRWFPTGEVAIEDGGDVFLVGARFEALSSAEEVYRAAGLALDELTGALRLFIENIRRPAIGALYREEANGVRHAFVFLSGTAFGRSKMHATLSGGGTNAQVTQAQAVLIASTRSSHFQRALALWGDPIKTWPRLYRILEEIERGLGKNADKAKLCSATQRRRFTHSANAAEVAGVDSRHAAGRFTPPSNPMTLDEAERFIGGIVRGALL